VKLTNEQITSRREAEQPDAEIVKTMRAYASGDHREVLSTQQNKLLSQRSLHPMVDNILALILHTTASRLKLTGWKVAGEEPKSIVDGSDISDADAKAVTAWLSSLWLLNRVPRLQYEVHYATLRDGNSAVSIAYRGGRMQLWREPWWDGDTGVFVGYADDGSYEFAVKEWDQRDPSGTVVRRRTIYEPGVIYRFERNGDGWKEYDRDGEQAEVRLERAEGEPLSIPIIHFPNGTGVTEGFYGQSDVQDMLALQDDLNATQRDISAAALLSAFQRIFLAGVDMQKKITMEPGGFFGTDKEAASLTVIPAGDLTQLTQVHSYKRQSMSIASRTPMHAITGEWPSGAALLQADMSQIEKVQSLGDVAGPQWTMVQHRAMEQVNAFGGMALNENVPVTSVFAPAERIDDLTALQIKQADATLWETLSRLPREAMIQAGVEEDTADKIVAQREAMSSVVADMGF
jgi:hypothetical protein